MISEQAFTSNPINGKVSKSNALNVSGSYKNFLQELVDEPARREYNDLFVARLRAISGEIGSIYKISGDDGVRQGITTRIESFQQSEGQKLQTLSQAWGDVKSAWKESLDSEKESPKYTLYMDIIVSGSVIKRSKFFYLTSPYGRLLLNLS